MKSKSSKAIAFFLIISICFQGCQSYKSVPVTDFKERKAYEITLKNEQVFEGKCLKTNEESVFLLINDNAVEIPKSEIRALRRKKVSVLRIVGGVAVTTVAIILIAKDAKRNESIVEELRAGD